jgi:predicted deacylase
MARISTAFTDVDLDRSGKQLGFVSIPHSPQDDAWGVTRIPIGVIRNGEGPTVLLTGGNHGDEHEGPIVLGELLRDMAPEDIAGRLIVLPALNAPAVAAGRRTSPVDGLNLNRTFPGNPLGSITEQISAYVADRLFPLADAFVDLHSGGSSLEMIPSAVVEPAPDPAHRRRNADAALAFGAPLTVVIDNLGDPRTSTAAAVRAGLTTVGTEMGGGGTVSPAALAICRRGVTNVLAHLGVLRAPVPSAIEPGRLLAIPGPSGFVFAGVGGVFEPFHGLGVEVKAGGEAGRVHQLTDPARQPALLRYGADGILYARRQPGRVEPGNCCLVVAADYHGGFA